MINLILWIWCLPQQIAALILSLFVKTYTKEKRGNVTLYKCNIKGGSISLGNKVFLCKSHWNNERVIVHEIGHTKQSLMLGWLYLIVIGLPSIIWAGCFDGYRRKHKVSYYWFWTESWADKLGSKEILKEWYK